MKIRKKEFERKIKREKGISEKKKKKIEKEEK